MLKKTHGSSHSARGSRGVWTAAESGRWLKWSSGISDDDARAGSSSQWAWPSPRRDSVRGLDATAVLRLTYVLFELSWEMLISACHAAMEAFGGRKISGFGHEVRKRGHRVRALGQRVREPSTRIADHRGARFGASTRWVGRGGGGVPRIGESGHESGRFEPIFTGLSA